MSHERFAVPLWQRLRSINTTGGFEGLHFMASELSTEKVGFVDLIFIFFALGQKPSTQGTTTHAHCLRGFSKIFKGFRSLKSQL